MVTFYLYNPALEDDIETLFERVRDAFATLHAFDMWEIGFTTRMAVHRARSRAALPLDEGGRGRYPSGYV